MAELDQPPVAPTRTRESTDAHRPDPGETTDIGTRWGGPDLDITVKRTCEGCNHGWMSDLENEAKPYLVPLIMGDRVRLDAAAQELVATWAFLRMVMAEYTHPRERAVPDAHRRCLIRKGRIPRKGVWVWIAGYLGDRRAALYRHVPLTSFKARSTWHPTEHTNAYGITFTVYRAVFQVYGVTAMAPGSDISHGGPVGKSTRRIWPGPKVAEIPPRPFLSDAELDRFANVFTQPPRVGR